MSVLDFITFIQHTPWIALLPIVGLGFLDALLGVWVHVVQGKEAFTWSRFGDWTENSVGVQKLLLVGVSALLVLVTSGTSAGVAALLALGATSGTAYMSILADVIQKGRSILSTSLGKTV